MLLAQAFYRARGKSRYKAVLWIL